MPKSAQKALTRQIRRDETPNLIPVARAAKLLGVSTSTVHRMRHHLRYTRVGGQILIHEDAVRAYIERNTFGHGR